MSTTKEKTASIPSLRVGFVGSSYAPEALPPIKPLFAASVSEADSLRRWARVYADTMGEAKARAEFVAHACNQHAALINALEVVLSSIEWSYPAQRMTGKEQADFIRSVIAKATL